MLSLLRIAKTRESAEPDTVSGPAALECPSLSVSNFSRTNDWHTSRMYSFHVTNATVAYQTRSLQTCGFLGREVHVLGYDCLLSLEMLHKLSEEHRRRPSSVRLQITVNRQLSGPSGRTRHLVYYIPWRSIQWNIQRPHQQSHVDPIFLPEIPGLPDPTNGCTCGIPAL